MEARAKIAVIEDDPDLLESYVAFLKPVAETHGFIDPAQFLTAVSHPNPKLMPDLVISDLRLPGTDGVRMIASARLSGAEFPAVLISGNLDKEAAVSATEVGVFRLLEKPFSREALLLVVNQLLAERELARIRSESIKAISRLRELHSMIKFVFSTDAASTTLDTPCLSSSASDEMQSLNETFVEIEQHLDSLVNAGNSLEEQKAKNNRELYQKSLKKGSAVPFRKPS